MSYPFLNPTAAPESSYEGLRDDGRGQRRGLHTVFSEIMWLFGLSRGLVASPSHPIIAPTDPEVSTARL